MLRAIAIAAALLAGSSAMVAGQELTGIYTVAGKNPDGSNYNGTATIAGTAGGVCGITWTIGSGQSSQAFCMRQGEVLGAAYVIGDSIGLVIYRLGADGVLDGTWSIAGQEGIGEERLTPQ